MIRDNSDAVDRLHIRWMIRRDMPEVLTIERDSFEFNWSEEGFIKVLRQRNCIGMVAELDNHVVGFLIYELHRTWLCLLSIAVAPTFRRLSVGSQMIAKLINKLSSNRRYRLVMELREANTLAEQFFIALGFRLVAALPPKDSFAYLAQYKHMRDDAPVDDDEWYPTEDCYVFELPGSKRTGIRDQ